MGWSWSVFLVQTAHLEVFSLLSLEGPWVRDKYPAISLDENPAARLLYIDNFVAVGYDDGAAELLVSDMVDQLADKGIRSAVGATEDGAHLLLGTVVDVKRGSVRIQPKRFHRLRRALDHFLRSAEGVCGWQVEKVVGHAISFMMLRRDSLSIFGAAYTFIREGYSKKQHLWQTVRRELE